MVFQLTKLVISLFWLHWKVKYLIVFESFGCICLWTGSKSCVSHSVKTCTLDPRAMAGPSAPWLRLVPSPSQHTHTLRASLESPAKLMLGLFGCKRKLEKTDPQSSPKPCALSENTCELGHSPQHESKLSHMRMWSEASWSICFCTFCHGLTNPKSSCCFSLSQWHGLFHFACFFPHVRVPVLDSLPRILPTFEVQRWVAARQSGGKNRQMFPWQHSLERCRNSCIAF